MITACNRTHISWNRDISLLVLITALPSKIEGSLVTSWLEELEEKVKGSKIMEFWRAITFSHTVALACAAFSKVLSILGWVAVAILPDVTIMANMEDNWRAWPNTWAVRFFFDCGGGETIAVTATKAWGKCWTKGGEAMPTLSVTWVALPVKTGGTSQILAIKWDGSLGSSVMTFLFRTMKCNKESHQGLLLVHHAHCPQLIELWRWRLGPHPLEVPAILCPC